MTKYTNQQCIVCGEPAHTSIEHNGNTMVVCQRHYGQIRNYGKIVSIERVKTASPNRICLPGGIKNHKCSIEGCENMAHSNSPFGPLCSGHQNQLRKYGTIDRPVRPYKARPKNEVTPEMCREAVDKLNDISTDESVMITAEGKVIEFKLKDEPIPNVLPDETQRIVPEGNPPKIIEERVPMKVEPRIDCISFGRFIRETLLDINVNIKYDPITEFGKYTVASIVNNIKEHTLNLIKVDTHKSDNVTLLRNFACNLYNYRVIHFFRSRFNELKDYKFMDIDKELSIISELFQEPITDSLLELVVDTNHIFNIQIDEIYELLKNR
jgi:hypothetical protein